MCNYLVNLEPHLDVLMLDWNWSLMFNIKLELGFDVSVKLELSIDVSVKLKLGLDVNVKQEGLDV